jgi:hypothetical protein
MDQQIGSARGFALTAAVLRVNSKSRLRLIPEQLASRGFGSIQKSPAGVF